MAVIPGTNVGETLIGTTLADTITGYDGDDIIYGLAGNDILYGGDGIFTLLADDDDQIYSGGGLDRLYGEFGNDTLVIDGVVANGSVFDGGGGTDTLLLKHNAAAAASPYGSLTTYNLFFSTILGTERLQFDTQSGNSIQANFIVSAIPAAGITAFAASGITELVGGGGRDLRTGAQSRVEPARRVHHAGVEFHRLGHDRRILPGRARSRVADRRRGQLHTQRSR